jgi:hypothetical protein
MAAAVILENGQTHPVPCFMNSACFTYSVYQNSSQSCDNWPSNSNPLIFKLAAATRLQNGRVYRISSKSSYKWPTYYIALIFKMASAAIFENGSALPALHFLNSGCFS